MVPMQAPIRDVFMVHHGLGQPFFDFKEVDKKRRKMKLNFHDNLKNTESQKQERTREELNLQDLLTDDSASRGNATPIGQLIQLILFQDRSLSVLSRRYLRHAAHVQHVNYGNQV